MIFKFNHDSYIFCLIFNNLTHKCGSHSESFFQISIDRKYFDSYGYNCHFCLNYFLLETLQANLFDQYFGNCCLEILTSLIQFWLLSTYQCFKVNQISQKSFERIPTTLESGIEVGPTVINLAFFSRPYGLIRDYIKVIQMVIYQIRHVYLRPYVYSFCQIFQALRLFTALRLLRTLEQVKTFPSINSYTARHLC